MVGNEKNERQLDKEQLSLPYVEQLYEVHRMFIGFWIGDGGMCIKK